MKPKLFKLVKSVFLIILVNLVFISSQSPQTDVGDYPIQPVPFTSVKITDNFWAPRIKTNHEVTIPIAIEQSTITGRIKNFEIAGGLQEGNFCSEYPFDDTDIYKIIEAASYSLQTFPDPGLEAILDSLIYKINLAQEEDGYLFTIRTIMGDDSHDWIGSKRWEKVNELSHELYNLGHMFEAAVAHYQSTGKRNFLDIAIKSADLIENVFGWGKLEDYPGHQEVELGLVKLYHATGNKKYLELAKFFLDVRGPKGNRYNQAHKKVINQTEGVGHAVRATYMYAAMADIAALFNDESYVQAIRKIWEDIVWKKTYITGGIGASGGNEGFRDPYNLPNMSAYCETCASIGNALWNHRMFLHDGNSIYYDVLERTLYNALLSGVSLSGDLFFYPNVLESIGQHQRSKWFGCACCPPNIARFLPSLSGYVYAMTDNSIFVNLFIDNTARIELKDNEIEIVQKTNYPWDGTVNITVNPEISGQFDLLVRIPGWAKNEAIPGNLYKFVDTSKEAVVLKVNNNVISPNEKSGYAVISKIWKKGDIITVELPLQSRRILADSRIEADKGRIAIQRGPLVYCVEWPDTKDGHVLNLLFNNEAAINESFNPELLNGVHVINLKATPAKRTLKDSIVFAEEQEVGLIPYYSWNNRGAGEMMVWLPVSEKAVRPLPAPTIASLSKVSGSRDSKAIIALNDQFEPARSGDRSWPYYHWWPNRDQWEWVQYDFEKPEKVSYMKVYWYDDGPYGGCRIPDKWELLYKSGESWQPVDATTPYKVTKNTWDELEFEPVTTTGLKLKVKLSTKFSSGIHEWVVK
ncbi:MAG: glycoside hydrolase family 127 protein [Bacteroidales bacterium]|nr:MAG: glycoside hydrolase family 127 protein [Bacteroidales bacterium]